MPLFFFFWRSIARPDAKGACGIWALILGSVVAFIQFLQGGSLLGAFVISPGAFGFSRWLSICVDIVTLPAVLPLLVCIILSRLRILIGAANYTNFALIWLIPASAIRAVSGAQNDPAVLVLTPILWTAIATGVPFFSAIMRSSRTHIPAAIAMAGLPFLAATAYWAFFSQRTRMVFLLLAATLIPMGISVTVSFYRSCVNS
jgi:hypothetical protein